MAQVFLACSPIHALVYATVMGCSFCVVMTGRRVPCKTVESVRFINMWCTTGCYNIICFEVCYIPVIILSSSACEVVISCLRDNCFCPTMYYKAVPQSGNKTKTEMRCMQFFLGTPFYYSFSQAHKNHCTTQCELQHMHRKTYTPWSYQIVKLVKGLIQLGIWMNLNLKTFEFVECSDRGQRLQCRYWSHLYEIM